LKPGENSLPKTLAGAMPGLNVRGMIRPVNLASDLAPLADLMELVFESTMDSQGRAALREMRMLSRLGAGLSMIPRVSDLAAGISMGVVYVEDGNLIGNVSIFPARIPDKQDRGWMIANVGVHPSYQGQGIARRLMQEAMSMIRKRGGQYAILQVDHDNPRALALYDGLGFVRERTFCTYRRSASMRLPESVETLKPVYIRHRRRGEWRQEMALASRLRPTHRGGLGWVRPVMSGLFAPSIRQSLGNLLALRQHDRLVVADEQDLRAVMWVDRAFGSSTRLTLMVDPVVAGWYDEALLVTAIRQYGNTAMVIEHPTDDSAVVSTLTRLRFLDQRTVVHMRWDPA
jgi:ribosomal protein S18 acetylase RimI-like enzyme